MKRATCAVGNNEKNHLRAKCAFPFPYLIADSAKTTLIKFLFLPPALHCNSGLCTTNSSIWCNVYVKTGKNMKCLNFIQEAINLQILSSWNKILVCNWFWMKCISKRIGNLGQYLFNYWCLGVLGIFILYSINVISDRLFDILDFFCLVYKVGLAILPIHGFFLWGLNELMQVKSLKG